MNGETAPAGADFKHMVVFVQIEFAANAVQFADRRLLQRHLRGIENCRGIHHGRVEKELEHVVTEIVVRGDVAAAAVFGVAVHQMQQFEHGFRQPCHAAFQAVHHILVQHHQADQGGQVVAAPVTQHPGFTGADGAAEGDIAIETGIMYMKRDFDGAVNAERVLLRTLAEQEAPVAQILQAFHYQRSGKVLQQACGLFAGQTEKTGAADKVGRLHQAASF